MDLLVLAAFGALVGAVASFIMSSSSGLIGNIILGVLGSVIGGWILQYFGESGVNGLNVYSFIVATLGACVLIFILRIVSH